MKWLVGLTLIAPLFWLGIANAQAGWEIETFNSLINIEETGSVLVQETITADFGSLEKHGIFRDLPVTYQSELGDRVYTQVSDIEVLQDGQQAIVEITRNSANMRIRIGDPGRVISGRHEYVITYRILGVLQAFDGFDELFWNVTGNDWEAGIQMATATVIVPAEVLQVACYEGVIGSDASCSEVVEEDRIVNFVSSGLAAGEGLTVAVGYTPGVVPIVTVDAPLSPIDVLLSLYSFVAGIIIFGVGSIWIVSRWWRYGRDRHWQRTHMPGLRSDRKGKKLSESILPLFGRQTISVEYDSPDNLRPAELGVLMDEQADTLDVSSTIVDLAARGYLTITEIPKKWIFGSKDYKFIRLDKLMDDLLEYEKELLERMFDDDKEVNLSDLKNKFYKDLKHVKDLLYQEVVKKGIFPSSPQTVRRLAAAKSVGIIALGIAIEVVAIWLFQKLGGVVVGQQILVGVGAGLAGVGIISLIFSRKMPRKTGYGRELYERTLGYEVFVSGTEKYRAKFLEDEGLFFKVLPYAIMFGVTDKLARAFKEMDREPPQPTWFYGASAFNATQFSSSMNDFSKSLSSAMASTPSSSGSGGGGFSGGGFGGGGGGSW